MIIRPAVESDLAQLLELYAQLHRSDPPLPSDTARAIWRQIEAQAGRAVLVAVDGDTVAGTVDVTVLPNLTRAGRPFVLVENVVVREAHRRSGIGARLMGEVETLARAAGCYKIQLMSGAARSGAHSFYEAIGFQHAQGYRRYLD
jgi:GNAT superfamily N-acetyltransferase